MSVILMTKDPFVEAEATTFTSAQAEQFNIRRPFFGTSLKDPRHAFLSVYQDTGRGNLVPISTKDSSAPGGWSNANHNFICQSVQVDRQEKVQIQETFGDHFFQFYGEKPIMLRVQGILLNTIDFNWKNEWAYNYENFLRGTKCAENRSRVFLGFDDQLIQGYVLACSTQYDKDLPYICPFSFQMVLSKPPLDLSPAAAGEISEAGTNAYVTQAAEARSFINQNGTQSGVLAEYIGSLKGLDGTGDNTRFTVNPLTGDAEPDTSFSPLVPNAVDNVRTAFWLSDANPSRRQWRTVDEALLEINTKITAEQMGVDDVTARQGLRNDPASFQLASRTDAVGVVSRSLTTGVSNSAAVISDSPGSVE